jgi:primosomal protein N' (replication factor Y)
MARKAGKYRGQLLLHCENRKSLHQQISLFIKKIERKKCTHRVKWSVDIDPVELF